jgi:hypothetical protein
MVTNVGSIDKGLRVAVGAALLVLTFVGPFTAALYPWGLLGIVPLATGLVGWCPLYRVLGINSCRTGR